MKTIIKTGLCVGLAATVMAGGWWGVRHARTAKERKGEAALREVPYPRIVSLSPALTEALYALGLGEHVVAVTRFCDYPPEAKALPKVGSLIDVDMEAVVRFRPDVVVAPPSLAHIRMVLDQMKNPSYALTLKTDRLHEIFDAMWALGDALGRQEAAVAWLSEMEETMANAKRIADEKFAATQERPKVLLCIGRDGEGLSRVYVAGPNTFYDDIITAVGGVNAYTGLLSYPIVAAEGLIQMNPDIIVEICLPYVGGETVGGAQVVSQWGAWTDISAVRSVHVYVITDDWAVRPGPRIGLLVQRLSDILHGYP